MSPDVRSACCVLQECSGAFRPTSGAVLWLAGLHAHVSWDQPSHYSHFWHPQRRNCLLLEVCIFQPLRCWQPTSPSAPALPHTFFFIPGSVAPASADPCEDHIHLVHYVPCSQDGSLLPAAPSPSTAVSIRRGAGVSWLMALHP